MNTLEHLVEVYKNSISLADPAPLQHEQRGFTWMYSSGLQQKCLVLSKVTSLRSVAGHRELSAASGSSLNKPQLSQGTIPSIRRSDGSIHRDLKACGMTAISSFADFSATLQKPGFRERIAHFEQIGESFDFFTDVALWYCELLCKELLGVGNEQFALFLPHIRSLAVGSKSATAQDQAQRELFRLIHETNVWFAEGNSLKDNAIIPSFTAKLGSDDEVVRYTISAYTSLLFSGLIFTLPSVLSTCFSAFCGSTEAERRTMTNSANALWVGEEVLRISSPISFVRRTLVTEGEIGGHVVAASTPVILFFRAANWDEDCFPDFKAIKRRDTDDKHVAFGVGSHHCIATRLSRKIVRSFLSEIADFSGARFQVFQTKYRESLQFCGPNSLKVSVSNS